MGYYIKQGTELKYVDNDGTECTSLRCRMSKFWDEWGATVLQCIVIAVCMVAFMCMLTGCSTVKKTTIDKQKIVKVDSVQVKDSTSLSQYVKDSLSHKTTQETSSYNIIRTTDSVVVASNKETTTTIVVDTLGKVLSQNTVTVITNDRDHWIIRDNNTNTLSVKVDSVDRSTVAVSNDTHTVSSNIVRSDSLLSQSAKTETVEKSRTLWDKIGDAYDGLCALIVIAFIAYVAYKVTKKYWV